MWEKTRQTTKTAVRQREAQGAADQHRPARAAKLPEDRHQVAEHPVDPGVPGLPQGRARDRAAVLDRERGLGWAARQDLPLPAPARPRTRRLP